MTKYVEFDSSSPDPKPIVGWYDTEFANYLKFPCSSNLIEVTEAQWTQHMKDLRISIWTIQNGILVHSVPKPPLR